MVHAMDLTMPGRCPQIYTHAGPVLIAVNPFKNVPALYTDVVLAHYKARPLCWPQASWAGAALHCQWIHEAQCRMQRRAGSGGVQKQ